MAISEEHQNRITNLETDLMNLINSVRGRNPTPGEFGRVIEISLEVGGIARQAIIENPDAYELALIGLGNQPRGGFNQYGEPFDACLYSIRLFRGMLAYV